MKEIPLTKGYVALINDNDFERVGQYKWYANDKGRGTVYASSKQWLPKEKRYLNIAMHRFIVGISGPYLEIDHINGDTLDNRKQNLRLANRIENSRNVKVRTGRQYKGVSPYPRLGKWRAYIQHDGKFLHLGYFTSPEAAAIAYNTKASELYGEFSRLNVLPNEREAA